MSCRQRQDLMGVWVPVKPMWRTMDAFSWNKLAGAVTGLGGKGAFPRWNCCVCAQT